MNYKELKPDDIIYVRCHETYRGSNYSLPKTHTLRYLYKVRVLGINENDIKVHIIECLNGDSDEINSCKKEPFTDWSPNYIEWELTLNKSLTDQERVTLFELRFI